MPKYHVCHLTSGCKQSERIKKNHFEHDWILFIIIIFKSFSDKKIFVNSIYSTQFKGWLLSLEIQHDKKYNIIQINIVSNDKKNKTPTGVCALKKGTFLSYKNN